MTGSRLLAGILFGAATGLVALAPAAARAGTRTLPGSDCDPGGNSFSYAKQSGAVRNAANVGVFYWCSIPRQKPNKKRIKRIELVVDRPAAAADFTCTFLSYGPTGDFVDSIEQTTSAAGVNTLVATDLATVPNGVATLACALPPQGRILSLTWKE